MGRLQSLLQWANMAVIITYDDPGGWYDHVIASPIVTPSNLANFDRLTGRG